MRGSRSQSAAAYFARNAAQWDQIRSLYVSEEAVEGAIVKAAGEGPFRQLVDLGSGTGRMLTLLGPKARNAIGLDLSQQMLNIARSHVANAELDHCELRHGDIFATRLPTELADLVVVHQVLHYLSDPAAAVREAARLVGEGGRLLIVDFAPHHLEFLREQHQHRRLGFSDQEIERWVEATGLGSGLETISLPPGGGTRTDRQGLDRRPPAVRPSKPGAPHERRRQTASAGHRPGRPRRRAGRARHAPVVRILPAQDRRHGADALGVDPPAGAAGSAVRLGDLWRRRHHARAHPPHRQAHPG